MAQEDSPPFRIPALGRWIARAFVTLGQGAKTLRPRGFGRLYSRGVEMAQRHYLVPVYALALVLSPFWALLVFEVIVSLLDQLSLTAPTESDARRAHFYAIGLTITGLGALLAAPFILIKAWVNERTARTAEQGHITDRITKAVEQLGAEKTVKVLVGDKTLERTEPNLEVRLGAIYALERIAQDSERDHIPIMETLCAYVRENSNARRALDPLESVKATQGCERKVTTAFRTYTMQLHEWARSLPRPRADVQATLTVVGRRSSSRRAYEFARGYQLDLCRANLQGADLSKLVFDHALLSGARLEGADLTKVQMERAILHEACLTGADMAAAQMNGSVFLDADLKCAHMNLARLNNSILIRANMYGANLCMAGMNKAKIEQARLESANLIMANLEGADLMNASLENAELHGASLTEAILVGASLQGVILNGANLKLANLAKARLTKANTRAANFLGALNLSDEQVNGVFGDRTTIIPDGLCRTDLMDREPLESPLNPDPDYEAWLAAGAPPGKPLP